MERAGTAINFEVSSAQGPRSAMPATPLFVDENGLYALQDAQGQL